MLLIFIIIFEILSLLYIKVFLDQRAVLEIGRAINFDIRNLVHMESYKFHGFAKYGRWIVLAIMFYLFGWKYPVGLFVVETIISMILPVPDGSYKEAMHNFRMVSRGDACFELFYEQAETVLRSNGVPF